mmetsp:Transcript_116/g.233  ORF Transcript_116/g.233 Transcript_116/m.233 type:complete len:306 (-) Transcript_116:16-933(-)
MPLINRRQAYHQSQQDCKMVPSPSLNPLARWRRGTLCATLALLHHPTISAFVPIRSSQLTSSSSCYVRSSASAPLNAAVSESDMIQQGTDIIRAAAVSAGAQEDNIDVEWSGDRIKVTISGELVSLGASSLDDEVDVDELDEDDELDLYIDADELDGSADDPEGVFGDVDIGDYVEDEAEANNEEEEEGPSITGIARAINRALAELGEGSIGDQIAQTRSIEVTTPGVSDVLQGDIMFEAYKGFEVMVETTDTNKKGKKKIFEGTLVERTDEHTSVNIKGRIKKIKNEKVECVRLPKAKKEKGAK